MDSFRVIVASTGAACRTVLHLRGQEDGTGGVLEALAVLDATVATDAPTVQLDGGDGTMNATAAIFPVDARVHGVTAGKNLALMRVPSCFTIAGMRFAFVKAHAFG